MPDQTAASICCVVVVVVIVVAVVVVAVGGCCCCCCCQCRCYHYLLDYSFVWLNPSTLYDTALANNKTKTLLGPFTSNIDALAGNGLFHNFLVAIINGNSSNYEQQKNIL